MLILQQCGSNRTQRNFQFSEMCHWLTKGLIKALQYSNVCLLVHTTFLKINQNWGSRETIILDLRHIISSSLLPSNFCDRLPFSPGAPSGSLKIAVTKKCRLLRQYQNCAQFQKQKGNTIHNFSAENISPNLVEIWKSSKAFDLRLVKVTPWLMH